MSNLTRRDRLRLHFLDNTDPDGMRRTLKNISARIKSTLVLVVSKSGGTPEPRNSMAMTRAAFDEAGLHFPSQAVAITGEGSKLDQVAVQEGWLERFPMWDWVGGRTSVTGTVGLVPAALQGVHIGQFLDGAARMDAATRKRDVKKNPAALLALAWYHATNGRGEKAMVVLPYKDRLLLLSRYLQQLVMESLGKKHDLDGNVVHQGISVYGNKGSTDQHAYVQQLRDGVHDFFVTFIQVLEDTRPLGKGHDVEVETFPGAGAGAGVTSGDYLLGFLLGTRQALYEEGRQSITIAIRRLTPQSLGALIALYERAVGFYATLVNINAYHQPGVEAGKKAAATVLELQHQLIAHLRATPETWQAADEIAAALGDPAQAENIHHLAEHLATNKRHVTRKGAKFRAL
jgi:glucose-6-phosphate isomerase